MLKRSDLAKQFELVVQQEIKNFQDSLNSVLQSIRDLNANIETLHNESLENHALIHSAQCDLASEIKNIKENFSDLDSRFKRFQNDQRILNERNAKEINDISDAVMKKIKIDSNFQNKIDDVCKLISAQDRKNQANFNQFSARCDDLLLHFSKVIAKVKKEILEAPTEAGIVKKQLEEKLACHIVDVAGIMRELKIYKHDNVVTQKKIEQIYTLIDRLHNKEILP